MFFSRLLRQSVLVLVLCTPRMGAAQAAGVPQVIEERYRALVQQGTDEFAAGRWSEAIVLFGEAHELQPSARTLRALGLAYFEDRKYVDALRHLRPALSDPRKPLTLQQRAQVFKAIEQAERFVARFQLQLQPPSAEVDVDGYSVRLDDGLLLLDPGVHEIVVSCSGCRTERRRVTARAGREEELAIDVRVAEEPEVSEVALPEEPTPPAEAEGPIDPDLPPSGAAGLGYLGVSFEPAEVRPRPGLLEPVGAVVVAGVGGALLLASAVTGVLAAARYDELEDGCSAGECPGGLRDVRAEGVAFKTATNALLLGGVAALATGAVWYVLARTGDESPPLAACGGAGCVTGPVVRF